MIATAQGMTTGDGLGLGLSIFALCGFMAVLFRGWPGGRR